MQNKKGVRLVSAKQEINQINDKEEKEKLTTNKTKKKIKVSQIVSTNQNNERMQNKSQTNFIRNSLSQSTKTS